MPASFYNIHNFIKVMVDSRKLNLAHDYEHYFRLFRNSDYFSDCDYTIKDFSDFRLPEFYINADNRLFGFKNGIYFPREKYAVILEGDKITEYTTYANRATNLWIQTLLLNKDLSFAHSLGVEIGGKGLIFPAFGGTGKTLLLSEMRKQEGFKFFGDDYVIVGRDAKMYSYPADLSIYNYHLPVFAELKHTSFSGYLKRRKMLSPYYNLIRVINFITKRLNSSGQPAFSGWNANYIKVPAVNIMPKEKIGTQTNLSAGIFLSRYSGSEIKFEEMSLEQFAQSVEGILHLEFGSSLAYLHSLSSFGLFDLAGPENNQREIIKQCFSKIKLYRILIPRDIDYRDYCGQIIKLIKEGII